MKNPIVRAVAVSSVSVLMLAGCSSKKLQSKIEKLEQEMQEQQIQYEDTISQRDRTIAEKVTAFDDAEGKAREKLAALSEERDRLSGELRDLQLKVPRMQAQIDAGKPAAGSPVGDLPDLAKDPKFSDAMVSIVGDVSKSTGVVIEDGGKRYIYTSGDTLGGNTRLVITSAGGTKFTKFGKLQTADGCALARIELLDDGAPAISLASSDLTVSGQNSLYCLSLSPGGSGSVSGAKVIAYNQTDDTIGCDISLLAGKPGAAIVDAGTGKVVAVVVNQAGAVVSLWERAVEAAVDPAQVQAAAQRVNRDFSWQAVPIKAFLDEGKRIQDFNRVTRVVHAFGGMTPGGEGLGMTGSVGEGSTVRSILAAASDVPVAAEAIALDGQLVQKKVRFGEADLKRRLKGLFSGVASQSKTGLAGFTPESFSTYHRKSAEQSLKWRIEAEQKLKATADTIESLSIIKSAERRSERKAEDNF